MTTTVPSDAALPQLAVALDGGAMQGVFADVLRPHGVRVESCRVERVKYRPGRNATLGYRLRVSDDGRGHYEQVVAARLCNGDAAARSARASRRGLQASRAGPALRWLPLLDMVTWWWPNDAKLRATHALADPNVLREQVLPSLMPSLGVVGHAARTAEIGKVDVVQYVPEHRLTARVDLRWTQAGSTCRQRVYAKASREPTSAVAWDLHRQLEASEPWRSGRLTTPRALLWHEASDTWWQQGLPGVPLLDADHALAAASMAPLGEQLAALHGCQVSTARAITPETLRARLDDVVQVLSPALGEGLLRNAAQAVARGLDHLEGEAMVTLHGDFHARNILVDGTPAGARASLIDLDGMQRGPALLELGAWIADAMYRALLDGAAVDRDQRNWRTLLDGYAHASGHRLHADALRWAVAWNLLAQRAWRCVVNLKPGRYAIAPQLVALSTQIALGSQVFDTP